jgi:hypothetical protein
MNKGHFPKQIKIMMRLLPGARNFLGLIILTAIIQFYSLYNKQTINFQKQVESHFFSALGIESWTSNSLEICPQP